VTWPIDLTNPIVRECCNSAI